MRTGAISGRQPPRTRARPASFTRSVHECRNVDWRYRRLNGPAVAAGGLPARPVSDGSEQSTSRLWRKRLLGESPKRSDGLPKLFEVGATRLALGEMRLESIPIYRRQPILKVVGNELDELPARHLGQTLVVSVAAKSARAHGEPGTVPDAAGLVDECP
jgi:hypothetical protein